MLPCLFVALAVVVRLIPHPFSFTPVGASLLFFGARAPRKLAWIPVVLLVASDVVLTRVAYGYPLELSQLAVWAWYAAMVLFGGRLLRVRATPVKVAGVSLVTAASFFLLSNFGVWLGEAMYPMGWSGLTACYAAAIPFFRNEVLSDVLFVAAMFGLSAIQSEYHTWRRTVVPN